MPSENSASPSEKHTSTPQRVADDADNDQRSSSTPLAGPGSTRQTRKLQLRKAGFRGKMVPNRNVTPKNNTPSDSWIRRRTPSGPVDFDMQPLSEFHTDGEKSRTPSGKSGILQEINNSSLRRKKYSRPRVDEGFPVFNDENTINSPQAACIDALLDQRPHTECLTPETASLSKSAAMRHQRNNMQRRESLSAETAKYMEHLESELAAAQTQLSSMTSPTVMQARSLKMRALTAEIRQLHDEVAQWETKYQERVQEEVEQRSSLEIGLKTRIRSLEVDTEEYAKNVRDLHHQLEASKASLGATESANLELERRLDVLTNLLASPQKQDADASQFADTDRKRHSRQRSMLPRFPTTGSLASLPKAFDSTGPTTPLPMHHTPMGPPLSHPTFDCVKDLQYAASQSSAVFASGHSSNDSPEEVGFRSARSLKRFSWSTPDSVTPADSTISASGGTGKPSRKMRRFHGGSLMPKPLLLPSTNCLPVVPASAPALEDHESPPAFPFPELPSPQDVEHFLSPLPGRRRAQTCSDGLTAALRRVSSSTITSSPNDTSSSDAGVLRLPSPDYVSSEKTLRDFSSLGSAVGRNLLEELQRAKDILSDASTKDSRSMPPPPLPASGRITSQGTTRSASWTIPPSLNARPWLQHQRSVSDQTEIESQSKRSFSTPSLDRDSFDTQGDIQSRSRAGSISTIFSDLIRNPYLAARECLSRAQSLSTSSPRLHRLQWWLVQFLLGPMLSRRLMTGAMHGSLAEHTASPLALMSAVTSGARSKSGTLRKRRRGNDNLDGDLAYRSPDSIELRDLSGSSTVTITARSLHAASFPPDHIHDQSSGQKTPTHAQGNDSTTEKEKRKRARKDSLIQRRRNMDGRQDLWFGRHSPWLWLRFSLTLAIAIGAALRDGPGVVMGLGNEGGGGAS